MSCFRLKLTNKIDKNLETVIFSKVSGVFGPSVIFFRCIVRVSYLGVPCCVVAVLHCHLPVAWR